MHFHSLKWQSVWDLEVLELVRRTAFVAIFDTSIDKAGRVAECDTRLFSHGSRIDVGSTGQCSAATALDVTSMRGPIGRQIVGDDLGIADLRQPCQQQQPWNVRKHLDERW